MQQVTDVGNGNSGGSGSIGGGGQPLTTDWVSILFVWHVAADLILFVVALLAAKTASERNRKVFVFDAMYAFVEITIGLEALAE